ncbi:flagellar hook-associated protein 1 FlgK [Virgibacillus subterraneus]|uniref:Flagellar hook-associated protein 1 n=2 Tax=Virgibacillus TaxID=84406 RepID=A0A1H0ZCU3_9BACI|nr:MULTISPECIES: flagellar hook-associated protein FlgK [Virgibacillus]SDQ25169.1 flagellar hook-associated protein 1 FlgK [Virgibacillus salinus]SEP90770.1 flagellar hook-associated protein 1 FlgK [Virgibacillus subterraneus]
MSTFHGLEMAKQALSAQQSALYTTGHNISNANTEGYSRQRVNFETTSPFPAASRNRPEIPGQMGTGVEAGSVQRVRNQFLDYQYRAENSKSHYWDTKADALSKMEGLLNEPSENGLNKTMDKFWQSLQDLSVNPENTGARSVVAQRGLAVAETFNYMSDSLGTMRTDLKDQIDVKVKDANSISDQINSLNKQIKNIETHGSLANDLYDERDRLVDELSGIVNIEVSYSKSSDAALDTADGLATIKLADESGKPLGSTLVNGDLSQGDLSFNEINVKVTDDAVETISADGETYTATEFTSQGSLKGFIESYGFTDGVDNAGNTVVKGEYPDMLADLDKMAKAFADEFNDVHNDGANLNGEQGTAQFFQNADDETAANITAGNITVSETILNNPDEIAASNGGGSGNGENASDLADIFDAENGDLDNASVRSYYESIIGDMGVNAQKANSMVENSGILRSQVEDQRMSVSSVSLDEEMSNMIKFQHAYSAAARSMTAVDEMIDRVINNMGLVGR